jgi:hypothetical protein
MIFRNFRIISVFVCAALIISACEKEVSNPNQTPGETPTAVPFFELAKGDTIAKGIYREKPDFGGLEEVKILYSSERRLRATGDAGNSFNLPLDGMKVSISKSSSVPDGYIPVDLNEGAGGKYIYLKCDFADDNSKGFKEIGVEFDALPRTIWDQGNRWLVTKSGSNIPADLNDGAGGDYVYFWTSPGLSSYGPFIRHIRIASSTSSSVSFSGWTKINKDLNKGAGGKYIYIFYQY